MPARLRDPDMRDDPLVRQGDASLLRSPMVGVRAPTVPGKDGIGTRPGAGAAAGEIVIDVLVAYTKKAAASYTDIRREVIELAIEEGNEAFRTSGLGNTPTTANNGILYRAARELWNVSASYKITKNFEVMVAGRNIFNAPDIVYSNVRSRVQQYSIYGSMWNLGIKGTF